MIGETHGGYMIGDYVVADHAMYDDFSNETYVIVALGHNAIGQELIYVVDITTQNSIQPRRLCFFPSELSYEDGTQPKFS